jgi:DNA-binding HxlR family transcriptional regulator
LGLAVPVSGGASWGHAGTVLAVTFSPDGATLASVLVLFGLSQQPRRHGELAGLIGGISRKVLTQTLRRLQQYGLVERHAQAPRQVEYSLTDLGATLIEPIEVLTSWARDSAAG